MSAKKHLRVGDLVKTEKSFIRINGLDSSSPFDGDLGIVVKVVERKHSNYVVVFWQKLQREYEHFEVSLHKVASID